MFARKLGYRLGEIGAAESMNKVLLVIWSLNADGVGAVMTDEFPTMEVCRGAEKHQRANGAKASCVLSTELDEIVAELQRNRCEAANAYMFVCKGRGK
jgi:hypothetical protein